MSDRELLVVEKVNKKYKDFSLKNISFTLPGGYILGLIGKNGAGKTTLMNCIIGAIPYQGKISVEGAVNTLHARSATEKVGFIVRLNDWEDKDISDDRMIEMKSGVTEIWVTSGQAEFVYEAPEGCSSYDFEGMEKERLELYDKADSLKVNVHYYNYDESYDTTEALAWKSKAAPGSYPLVETDAYGAVYHIGLAVRIYYLQ